MKRIATTPTQFPLLARRPVPTLLACALAGCLAVMAPAAMAQSTAATIRGQVTVDAAPASDARVTATNVATGLSRSVQASASGAYSLVGLPPGTYRVDVIANGATTSQTVTVQVGQTATLDLAAGGVAETGPVDDATDVGTVTVTAPVLVEARTSEVATYVSQKQIEALPQGSRNFLAFADTVPGIVFEERSDGSTNIRSGAQQSNGVNVFLDGVGQKNYVTRGGITGQDTSRGNPFPQLGIGEYKVITSNYKAEYDQISSAAVSAVTRSGTNEFEGNFFWDYTSDQWREPTVIEEKSGSKAQSKEEQYGVALGGPIMRDRLFFFATYEAKEFNSPREITPGRNVTIDELPAEFQPLARATDSAPFKSDLFFGKLTFTPDDRNLLELSYKGREEDELTNVGGQNTASYGTLKTVEDTRVDLRWQYSADRWLNDMHLTYEDSFFSPRPQNFEPGYNLRLPAIGQEDNDNPTMENVLNLGGSPDFQNKGQEGTSWQNDFTFFGFEGHTVKAGFKFKAVELTAFEQQPFNAQYRFDGNRSLTVPYEVEFAGATGLAPPSVVSKNKQYGFYVQDDWEVNDKLTLNLGLRWDYEEVPSYDDFVTPASLVGFLQAYPNIQDTDYDIDDYISTGNNRESFKDAWQPRLGFSYDLFADQRHVIFGGAGRAYDRNLFDFLSFERYRLAFKRDTFQFNTPGHPCDTAANPRCLEWDPIYLDQSNLDALVAGQPYGTEVFLLNNELKTPYSDQFSLGIRNAWDLAGHEWISSVTLAHILSHDGIYFHIGNRQADGSFFAPGRSFGDGFGTIINNPLTPERAPQQFFLADNGVETRTNQVLVSMDKPYTVESGWGVTMAYTYSKAKENLPNSDIFTFDYRDTDDAPFVEANGLSQHRFVGTGIVDFWGMTLSSKLTLASHTYRSTVNCFDAPDFNNCFFDPYQPDGDSIGFKQFDLALQKEWDTGSDLKLRVRGDVFNVFNWRNYTDFDGWRGGPGDANPNFAQRNGDGIVLPTREFKLTFGLAW